MLRTITLLLRLAQPEKRDWNQYPDCKTNGNKPGAIGRTKRQHHPKQNREEQRDRHQYDQHLEESWFVFPGAGFTRVDLVHMHRGELRNPCVLLTKHFVALAANGLIPTGRDEKDQERREKNAEIKV